MTCRARAYYRTQTFGVQFKCAKCLDMIYGRGITTGPCGHILCPTCDAEWAAFHPLFPTVLSDYEPLEVEQFTAAVAVEEANFPAAADEDTLPWIPPPNEIDMSDGEEEEPVRDAEEGLFYGRPPPPMPSLTRATTIPRISRFHALGYEMLQGSETFLHLGAACVWCFSTRFWECVLLDVENSTLVLWSSVPPVGLADWSARWRAVQRPENRRWVLEGGTTPLSRVAGLPHRAEHF